MKDESKRRHDELLETFRAVDACLASYYLGHLAIYRPLSSQLRLLYCDTSRKRNNSLLVRCFDDLRLSRVRPIEWKRVTEMEDTQGPFSRIRASGPNANNVILAKMPFTVTTYANGLNVADLDLDAKGSPLPLVDWLKQAVTDYRGLLTIGDIIRAVANKGGGAHVDDEPNWALRTLRKLQPASLGCHVLFTVAIGRFTQYLGVQYAQFRDRAGYDGDIGALAFDSEHPAAKGMAQVDPAVTGPPQYQQSLLATKILSAGPAEGPLK